MDDDIKVIIDVTNNISSAIDKYSYTTTSSELIRHSFSKTNPLTRSFLLLMAQKAPMDMVSGSKIDIGQALASYNRKEYHHVFPNAFLTKRGLNKTKRFSIVNFCFLPSGTNKKISSKKPSEYFFDLVPQDRFSDILDSNLLPLKKDIYKDDDYDKFLERRAELVIGEIDQVCKS